MRTFSTWTHRFMIESKHYNQSSTQEDEVGLLANTTIVFMDFQHWKVLIVLGPWASCRCPEVVVLPGFFSICMEDMSDSQDHHQGSSIPPPKWPSGWVRSFSPTVVRTIDQVETGSQEWWFLVEIPEPARLRGIGKDLYLHSHLYSHPYHTHIMYILYLSISISQEAG